MKRRRLIRPIQPPVSGFAGFRFPPEVILIAVRWYLRYGLSSRDLEELLAERGIEVDHVTLFRWVQRFTPLLIDAARPCRHSVGGHWFVDETYVKVSGSWRYVYRAVDQYGQVIDVFVSKRRDLKAATKFFANAIDSHGEPAAVTTDRAHALIRVVADLLPAALHDTTQYANNWVEADHGRLKARLRPMRGLKRDRTASVVIRGHAFIQNLRRGHYELGIDARPGLRLAAVFHELQQVISAASPALTGQSPPVDQSTQQSRPGIVPVSALCGPGRRADTTGLGEPLVQGPVEPVDVQHRPAQPLA